MINPQSIWYDADTLLEEVLDTMPDDIKELFETEGNPTENDMDESWKTQDLNEMSEWDEFGREEWEANQCCPNSSAAAANFCGCGGSGEPPEWVQRNWEMNR